jgi:hypothetical protein
MQSIVFGYDFQATVTAYDTTNAIIGSVSVNGVTQGTTGTLPVIGATSPVPIAKLVLFTQAEPDAAEGRYVFLFGTIYFDPGMSICTPVWPFGESECIARIGWAYIDVPLFSETTETSPRPCLPSPFSSFDE